MDATALETSKLLESLATLVSTWGLKVVGALAVLVVGRIVCGSLRHATPRALERGPIDESLAPFLSNLVYYLALTVVVVAVLNLFGIQTASLIAVIGAAGLAVGLALQGTLSNLASGVMLLVFRPFKPGDYVEVAGTAGTVQEVGVFSTTLHIPDNVRIIVPNSSVYGDTVKNYSANDTRRVSDYWPVRFDLTRELKQRLEAAGCTIPFPQRDVHVQPSPPSAA